MRRQPWAVTIRQGTVIPTNILKVGGFVDPLKKEGQVELSRNLQIGTAFIDSTGLCIFVAFRGA